MRNQSAQTSFREYDFCLLFLCSLFVLLDFNIRPSRVQFRYLLHFRVEYLFFSFVSCIDALYCVNFKKRDDIFLFDHFEIEKGVQSFFFFALIQYLSVNAASFDIGSLHFCVEFLSSFCFVYRH